MKYCAWCKTEKPLDGFHKHKGMRDGRLNKCGECVLLSVAAWRKKNPDARKIENIKVREKAGTLSRDKYFEKRKQNSIGRKVSSSKYASKRRLQTEFYFCKEYDTFVFEEALKLCQLREIATGFKWNVDHIVPLNHKIACGLHVADNFQVVPARWNFQKMNKNMSAYSVSGY